MLFKITADQTQRMLKQKCSLLQVRTTSIHVDPSERTIKSALSPKLIKLMIPPWANPRRLDRVRVPPSTSRLEGTATASLSLYLYSIQPVASLSFFSRGLTLPENRARRNCIIWIIDSVKMQSNDVYQIIIFKHII